MHENKAQLGTRKEIVHGVATSMKFRGPFDFVQYNHEISNPTAPQTGTEGTVNAAINFMGVSRPTAKDYPVNANGAPQSHASTGVQVELVDADPAYSPAGALVAGKTFTYSDALNSYGDYSTAPRVKPSDLRYRVRFMYPRDPLVAGGGFVDPAAQYLLDTPVFDDISVTYIYKIRFLDFHQVNE